MNVPVIVAIIAVFYIVKFAAYSYFAHFLNKVAKERRSIFLIGIIRLLLGAAFGFALVYIFGKQGRGPVFTDSAYLILFFMMQAFLWALIISIFYRSLLANYQWIKWMVIGTVLSMIVNIPLYFLGTANLNPG